MQLRHSTTMAVALCLLPALLFGLGKDDVADQLPANYVFDLEMQQAPGKATHIAFTVASRKFEVSTGTDAMLRFSGTVSIVDGGVLFVSFNLGLKEKMLVQSPKGGPETFQFVDNGLMGSVRLQEGKPVSLLSTGDRSFRLTVTRLAPE